jgi:hypothetical protein
LKTENRIKSIVIPVFGGLTGGIAANIVAELMHKAVFSCLLPKE